MQNKIDTCIPTYIKEYVPIGVLSYDCINSCNQGCTSLNTNYIPANNLTFSFSFNTYRLILFKLLEKEIHTKEEYLKYKHI